MIYSTVYGAVTTRVNDSSTATTNVAKAAVNDAQRDVCARHPFSWLLTTGTITTTASQSYSVISTAGISNYWKMFTAREAVTPRMLARISMDKWEEFQIISSNEDIPTHFSDEYDDRIYWYPTPADAYSIYIRYFKQVADLSADADSSIIPARWHEVLILGGWYRTLQYLKEYGEAQAIKGEYEEKIQQMIDDDDDKIGLIERQEKHIIGKPTSDGPQMPSRYRRF